MQKKQDQSKNHQQKPSHSSAPKAATPVAGKKDQMGSCSSGDKGKKGGSCG